MKNIQKFSVPYKVAQTANKINQSLSKTLKEYDIASEQRAILNIIDKDGKVSQNELSQILGKDKTTISRTLDALEKRGYIKREFIKKDKRVRVISLSFFGKEILEQTEPIIAQFREAVLFDFAQNEIEQIFTLLEKVSTNIDKYNNEK